MYVCVVCVCLICITVCFDSGGVLKLLYFCWLIMLQERYSRYAQARTCSRRSTQSLALLMDPKGFFSQTKKENLSKMSKDASKKCMQHLDRAKNCKLCENVAVKTMLCLPYQLTWSLSCVIHWKATGKHCLSHVTPLRGSIPGTLVWLDSWNCWRHHFGNSHLKPCHPIRWWRPGPNISQAVRYRKARNSCLSHACVLKICFPPSKCPQPKSPSKCSGNLCFILINWYQ